MREARGCHAPPTMRPLPTGRDFVDNARDRRCPKRYALDEPHVGRALALFSSCGGEPHQIAPDVRDLPQSTREAMRVLGDARAYKAERDAAAAKARAG